MNRPLWKLTGPALAVGIIIAGLLWQILACTESPMAFSPDGKNLVFTILEPYESSGGNNDNAPPLCRLMVLANAATPDAQNLRILEERSNLMLTGPTFSPDGKQFCYLRITLPKDSPAITPAAPTAPATTPATSAATSPALPPELIFPGDPKPITLAATETIDTGNMTAENPGQALLVFRDAATFSILSTVQVEFTLDEKDDSLAHPYLTLRPQYGPEGNIIFYTDHLGLHGVNLKEQSSFLINRRAMCPAVSPDHKTIAFIGSKKGDSLVLFSPELTSLTERFLPEMVSPSGLFWLNNDTLAVLIGGAKNNDQKIMLFANDGKPLRTLNLPEFKDTQDEKIGELAIAPDGRLIVCYNTFVRFFDASGKLLHEVPLDENTLLAQPTFTPDGTRIAFKELTKTKSGETETTRVFALVFYNLDAQELSRIPLPQPQALP